MTEKISDLADLVKQWASARSERFGTICKWIDLHAAHARMAEYQRYKLNIQVINIHYGGVIGSSELPGSVVEDTTVNDTSQSQLSVFRHTKEVTSTFTWTLKNSIRTGSDTRFTVAILPIISTTINSTEVSTDTTLSMTETDVETWSIERHVTVPAHSKMDMIWTVKEQESSGRFFAEVKLTGHIAAWNDEAIDVNDPDGDDVHYLWFTKIAKVFTDMKEWGIAVPSEYSVRGASVIYTITGDCEGVSGYDTSFVLNETPLNATKTTHGRRCVQSDNIPGQ